MASLEIPSLNGDSLAITIPFWVVPKVNSPTKVDLFKNREEKSHWWILGMKEGWDGLIWPKHPHCATCCSRRPQLWVLPPNMDHGLPSLLMDSEFQIPKMSSLLNCGSQPLWPIHVQQLSHLEAGSWRFVRSLRHSWDENPPRSHGKIRGLLGWANKKISASFGFRDSVVLQPNNPELQSKPLWLWNSATLFGDVARSSLNANRLCMVYVRLIYNHLLYIHSKNQLVMSASNTGCPSKQKMRRFTAFIIGCIHENLKRYAKNSLKDWSCHWNSKPWMNINGCVIYTICNYLVHAAQTAVAFRSLFAARTDVCSSALLARNIYVSSFRPIFSMFQETLQCSEELSWWHGSLVLSPSPLKHEFRNYWRKNSVTVLLLCGIDMSREPFKL